MTLAMLDADVLFAYVPAGHPDGQPVPFLRHAIQSLDKEVAPVLNDHVPVGHDLQDRIDEAAVELE